MTQNSPLSSPPSRVRGRMFELLNIYPSYAEFDVDNIMYGLGAPYVGIGVYTLDKKFSWPDRECTTKEEYDSWVKWLTDQGYAIPEKYKDAYFQPPTEEVE